MSVMSHSGHIEAESSLSLGMKQRVLTGLEKLWHIDKEHFIEYFIKDFCD